MLSTHKTLIPSTEIHARIESLAAEVAGAYKGSQNLVLICVLQGARQFEQALSDALTVPHRRGTIQVASYGVGTYLSTGNVVIKQPLDVNVQGADVVIVEDIIDTGYSMQTVLDIVQAEEPNSIKVCALLSKPSRRVVSVPIDFLGFSIEDHFVFGYGIDVDQKHRELDYIGYFE